MGDFKLRVLFSCSGVGILNRGIESFFREAFDGLQDLTDVEILLLKGNGPSANNERVVSCLPRTTTLAKSIGKLTGRSAYAVEQWSSFPAIIREIRRFRPHVVFYSDSNLGFLLYRFKKWIGVPFNLLFSNGGPCSPPFSRHDFIHQVAPYYYDQAIAAGESRSRHITVPYGIRIAPLQILETTGKSELRNKLNLPINRPIVLSVGWIAREHKRMDYVIREIARLPEPRPYLQLLGAIDDSSPEIIRLGNKLLGEDNFSAKSVPYEKVTDFYRVADVFVLGSLKEGFGRVYIEAMMHGLPVIGHDHPVIRYVLGEEGTISDLTNADSLANAVQCALKQPCTELEKIRRWKSVQSRFSWESLCMDYRSMFFEAKPTELY